MSASCIFAIQNGKPRPIVAQPKFSTASVPWAGFLLEECTHSVEVRRNFVLEKPTLFVCTRGQGTIYWRHRGSVELYNNVTGSTCIASTRFETDAHWASNSWDYLALALDTSKFSHLAPREAKAIDASLVHLHFSEDVNIASLISLMHAESKAGCPSGRLYAESLSLALLAYLTGKYTDHQLNGDHHTQLSPEQKRRVVSLIRGNLGTEIGVSDLADALGVSAAHFSRLFKASFGISPHRFIMKERVAKAKTLLSESRWTVAYIAAELGFSSHSHFTKVFHSLVGLTPRQFRDGR